MRMFGAILFSVVLFVPSATAQAPSRHDAVPHPETTAGMVEQLVKERKEADTRLKVVYNKLLSQLDEAGKAKLRVVEKDWLRYRDAQIAFEGSLYEGGSIRPLIEGNCLLAMTRNRTKQLQEVLDTNFGH